MKMRITPQPLQGELSAMPSKSMGHRLGIGATLAGQSSVANFGNSVDMDATLAALAALGWPAAQRQADALLRTGSAARRPAASRQVYCAESGSTLRILLPLAWDGVPTTFTGAPRLMERSMEPYAQLCKERQIAWKQSSTGISVCGTLEPGDFTLRGDVSSQFISGLLFALPTLAGDSRIALTGKVESRAYIDLTLQALSMFGIAARWEGDNRLLVPGGQRWQSAQVRVEGDYSHAAFFLVAGALGAGKGVTLHGLDAHSRQGDRAMIDILRQMGADIRVQGDSVQVQPSPLRGTVIDVAQIPDLVPVLAVAGCAAQGETHIINAGRLRDKESDRLAAMTAELSALGAQIYEEAEGLRIYGGRQLTGAAVAAHNDHRIAMALAISAALCQGALLLDEAQSVRKSAPQFWQEFERLGGQASPQ